MTEAEVFNKAEALSLFEAINRMASPGNRTLDDLIRDLGYVCDTARRGIALLGATPPGLYGEMCRDPNLCSGKGYCPRDPTCGD